MSVVLSKRGSSKFEVIDNAMNIRKIEFQKSDNKDVTLQ